MDKKKTKINIILIIVIIFLAVTVFMVRIEFNPISYLLSGNEDDVETDDLVVNYNGIYVYKEVLNKAYKLFNSCTLSYYDYYIVVLNDNYYRYKSTCVGTFLLDEGKTVDLTFKQSMKNNTVITFDTNEYLKAVYISSIEEGNYFKKLIEDKVGLYADTYHILMKESQLLGKEFSAIGMGMDTNGGSFLFNFRYLNSTKQFRSEVIGVGDEILYSYTVSDLDSLPLFFGFGSKLTIIEPVELRDKYAYTFKSITKEGINYDLKNKFPITVDGDMLTYTDSIYIKFLSTDNVFVMLVGDNKNLCEKNSESKDVAYYVFHIKYDYATKNFTNPVFIKKVYKNEGCKYVDDLMGG